MILAAFKVKKPKFFGGRNPALTQMTTIEKSNSTKNNNKLGICLGLVHKHKNRPVKAKYIWRSLVCQGFVSKTRCKCQFGNVNLYYFILSNNYITEVVFYHIWITSLINKPKLHVYIQKTDLWQFPAVLWNRFRWRFVLYWLSYDGYLIQNDLLQFLMDFLCTWIIIFSASQ